MTLRIDQNGYLHIHYCTTCHGTGLVIEWDYTKAERAKLIQCSSCNGSGKQVTYTTVSLTIPTSRTNGGGR